MDILTTFCFWCFWVTLGVIAYAQRPGTRFELGLVGLLAVSGAVLSLAGLPVTADGGAVFIAIIVAADVVGLVSGRLLRSRIVLHAPREAGAAAAGPDA